MASQINRRTFVFGLGATAAGAALAACSPGGSGGSSATPTATPTGASSGSAPSVTPTGSSEAAVKSITFLSNNQDPTSPPTVKKWNGLGKPFSVKLQQTDAATYADAFPRLATAKGAPNIAGYFIDGGHFTDLAKAGALLELTPLWDASGLTKNVPDLILKKYQGFAGDGKIYGAPTNTSRYGCLFYLKSTLQKAGVTPPTDHEWESEDEWNAACAQLKKKGLAPISIGGKDGYPISHLQDGLLSSVMAPDQVNDPLTIDYTSDAWKAPVAKLLEWNQKGYFAKGFLGRSTDQSNAYFAAQKQAGFSTGMNVWEPLILKLGVPESDLDWCLLPPIGSLPAKMSVYAGGGIVIPAIATAHDEALTFGEWLVAPDQALDSAKAGAVIPARTDVPGLQAALGPIGGSMFDKANEAGKSQFGWDDPAPTDMITYDRTNLQAVLAGTLKVDAFCAQLEKLKKGHA